MLSVYLSWSLSGDNGIQVFVTLKSSAEMEGGIRVIIIIIIDTSNINGSIDNHQLLFFIPQAQECGRV